MNNKPLSHPNQKDEKTPILPKMRELSAEKRECEGGVQVFTPRFERFDRGTGAENDTPAAPAISEYDTEVISSTLRLTSPPDILQNMIERPVRQTHERGRQAPTPDAVRHRSHTIIKLGTQS